MLREYLKTECPNCGTASLYNETAHAADAVVFDTGEPVEAGQRLTRCDTCGVVVKAAAEPKPKTKPKRSGSGSSSRRSSSRRLRDRVRGR